MSAAIQNLENDHIHIMQLTDVMKKMVQVRCSNTDHFERVVNLIQNFADGFHHAKEENLLFPLMGTKGFSDKQGPVAVMLSEHDMGRAFTREIAKNVEILKQGKYTVLPKIYTNMESYANLLHNHILKENDILFKMADQALNPEEQQTLFDQFIEVENKNDTKYNAENSINEIKLLASIYL